MARANLTHQLAEFIATVDAASIPQRAREIAVVGIVDAIGTMIAGRHESAPSILQSVVSGGAPEAHVAFTAEKMAAPNAAWVGATASHALDYDDVSIQGHPSAVLTPALLAEAEMVGASGYDLVSAYVVGFEAWAETILREPDQHHRKGWHPTGLFGVIGVAAACARLRRLTVEQTRNALGLAASQSAGIMANFGSMAKPFHAGCAAHNGIMAARLAQAGMTASIDALEHAQGILNAASPEGRVDVETPVQAGTRWQLIEQGLSIKKYPTCLSTHRTLDGLIDLATERNIEVSEVRGVELSMSGRNLTILRNHAPQTGLEAKFSGEFAVASALLVRRLTLDELGDSFVSGPEVQDLMKRVSLKADPREDPITGYAPYDEIIVHTADRGSLTKRVSDIRGGAKLPLSRDELFEKFAGCLRAGEASIPARSFFDQLLAIESITSIPDFIAGMATR